MRNKKPLDKRAQIANRVFWTPTRVLVTMITMSLLAAVGVSSCQSGDETSRVRPAAPKAPVSSAPNAPAAPVATASLPSSVREAELPSANGQAIKLANYSGKVILINLWATWCGPCRLETPELVRLHKEYRSKGLEMVGLSTENPDASAESVRNFVRDFNVDYPIGWATPEVAMSFMQLTGRNAIPQSFIIAPDGRILNRFVGFNAAQTPEQLRQAIEQALNGSKAD
jgi:thiol-disulfide isomerase/thioredoxin